MLHDGFFRASRGVKVQHLMLPVQRGYSLLKENTPLYPPEKDEGASSSTPDIAGLMFEELHALRSVGAVYMASP